MKDASKYANSIHTPLLEEADSTRVIDRFPPPELHMLIGGVNAKVNLLIKMYGRETVETWLHEIGVMRHRYNGGGCDGNNSKRVLDMVDRLAQLLPNACAPIVEALRALKAVVEG